MSKLGGQGREETYLSKEGLEFPPQIALFTQKSDNYPKTGQVAHKDNLTVWQIRYSNDKALYLHPDCKNSNNELISAILSGKKIESSGSGDISVFTSHSVISGRPLAIKSHNLLIPSGNHIFKTKK